MGSLISIVTFLLVLGLEVYMHDGHCASEVINSRKSKISMEEVLKNDKMKMRRRLILETYLTQLALSTHSFFECMSIGIELN